MRALLESLIPEAETYAGNAESIPLGDDSVDAVFSADAFHWFDGELALADIVRVLRPRGGLVLMWNEPDKPTEPSIAAAGAPLNERGSSERQINRYASGAWREPFAGSRYDVEPSSVRASADRRSGATACLLRLDELDRGVARG